MSATLQSPRFHGPPEWEEVEGSQGEKVKQVKRDWLARLSPTHRLDHIENIVGEGGFVGEIARLFLKAEGDDGAVDETWVLKQLTRPTQLATSLTFGLVREADFYNHAHELVPALVTDRCVPRVHYAWGDAATGERLVIMEDLGKGVQLGFLFGPLNPNNWPKHASGQLAQIEAAHAAKDPEWPLERICELVFRSAARMHAANWNNASILQHDWLHAVDWWRETQSEAGRKEWHSLQNACVANWQDAKNSGVLDNEELFPKELVEIVDASLARISFDDYIAFNKRTPFSLVHADFHPANMMWMPSEPGVPDHGRVKFLDWEVVGVGSGPQDLGQFLLSHAEPQFRQAHDKRLVRAYFDELLLANPAIEMTFEECWSEYTFGGAARFLWFSGFGAKFWPPKMASFFCNQTLSFLHDYGITAENVPQPRC